MQTIATKPYNYRMIECLGEGLNSCVYRAFKESKELNVKFEVALKILKSQKLVSLWRNELERLLRVKSQHCVLLHGWEIINNSPTLVLEYVRGVNLDELIRYVSLSNEEIENVYAQAFRGLQDLALAGLCHGDLNLHNIMVNESGTVKLVDFGISNGQKDYFVTPKFAAPSVLMGAAPNFETDLFSLDAIRLELKRRQAPPIDDENTSKDLSKKVQIALHRREADRQRTNAYTNKKSFQLSRFMRAPRTTICVFILFISILSLGDSAHKRLISPAHLIIRTVNWLKISIDGRALGYSPVETTISASHPVHVHWQGPIGHGDRTLTFQPGKTATLTDRFFSPNHK